MCKQFDDLLKVDTKTLSEIYSNTPCAMIFYNEKLEPCGCNKILLELFSCDSETQLIENYANFSPLKQPNGDMSTETFNTLIKSAVTGNRVNFDWQFIDTLGKMMSMNVTIIKIKSNEDDVSLVAFLQDVSIYARRIEIQNTKINNLSAFIDATPIAMMVWNEDYSPIMCNTATVELFDAENKQAVLENFDDFLPIYQPDGTFSDEIKLNYMQEAFLYGKTKFMWQHCKKTGEEIPVEITVIKLSEKDEMQKQLAVAFLRDLRVKSQENDEYNLADEYFFNQISDKKMFDMVAELSEELFFFFDVKTSLIQFLGKGSKLYSLSGEKTLFPEKVLEQGTVHEDDILSFIALANDMKQGVVSSAEIRLVDKNHVEKYYKFIYKTIFNKKNEPVLCIGKAMDINEQKSLEILSKTDLLTNCYNKISAENLITDTLLDYRDGVHALYIVDIDNFKAINDNLGHHFGDMVLSEVSANLRNCFRNADIIGRIGGDEFIVLLKNVQRPEIVEDKAKKIAEAFQNTYSGEYKDYKISGSIGIASYPKDGKTYEQLYKAADKALYQSKLRGKDCYTFYTDEFYDGTMRNRTTLENASRIANSYFDSELVSTVFNLMYETREIHSSLNAVMKFIGKRANADRCYIFESFDDGKTYDNTYEWCAKGIQPEIDNLQNLTAEILYDFFANADEKGIFYSNDLRLLKADGAYDLMNDQGIKSFLHVQIRRGDCVKLFLGLDDCTKTRVWNEKEINSILYAVKMISIFLLSDQQNKFIDEVNDK